MANEQKIVETEAKTEAERLEAMKPDPGFEDGTIVQNTSGENEKIVLDKDAEGVVVGWHKEKVEGV